VGDRILNYRFLIHIVEVTDISFGYNCGIERAGSLSLTIGIMEQWNYGILGRFAFHLVEKKIRLMGETNHGSKKP